jgi:hypothetical protein
MERAEICRHIDDGANFYLRVLGDAAHMEYITTDYYSIIRPKSGEEWGQSLFDIRVEHLPDDELQRQIDEIKKRNLHTWWGFNVSERMLQAIHGTTEWPQAPAEPTDDEAYMALLPEEKPSYPRAEYPIAVQRVDDPNDFKTWAAITNSILHGGFPIIHPENHYHLCESGIMTSYLGYLGTDPVATSAVLDNQGICSLEFVATIEAYRRKGVAKAACMRAVEDAFASGAKIITARGFADGVKLLRSLEFKAY